MKDPRLNPDGSLNIELLLKAMENMDAKRDAEKEMRKTLRQILPE